MLSDPASVGRYDVVSRLGQGGLGDLFLARDPLIDRMVAIKIIREGVDSPDIRERFLREARAAGRLSHPNIVTIFDVGEADGRPFIAMEYVRGETLKTLIETRVAMALTAKLRLLEELCDGLRYAHRSGLIHRDVKPANLIIDNEGTLKILDFGIARFASSSLTQVGMLVGTLSYMSPEQITGQVIDHRSDIFAVGAVGYELLSYQPAFSGSLQDGIAGRVLNATPIPLAQLCPDLDPEVIAILDRALQKDPANRYQDLGAMKSDIARVRRRLESLEPANLEEHAIVVDRAPGRLADEQAGNEARRREELEDERRAVIADALGRARAALAAGELKSAARAADEALARDRENREALRIKEETRRGPTPIAAPDSTILIQPRALPPAGEGQRRAVDDATGLFLPQPTGKELPDVRLVISHGNSRFIGQSHTITSANFVIGRAGDLQLPEPSWTRSHALIEYTDAGFSIRDLGSRNGTYVNGKRISGREPLFFGATIQIGEVGLTFSSGLDTTLPDVTEAVVDDRYILQKLLRQSTKGAVYLARHKHFPGEVVIKLLSPELVRYPGYREQFLREAEMAAELRHPHICKVIGYGPAEIRHPALSPITTHYLCLEFMAGGTLAKRLDAKTPFTNEQMARWIRVLADALQYAHRRSVIHGNLKPTSVVFDAEEQVYLTDFAIAQRVSSGESAKPVMGTAAYMAPELWDTGTVTAAIDQFALAALAYYMATGSRPFEGQDHPEVRRQNFRRGPAVAHEEARRNNREMPAGASRVLAKALATAPDDRYASVAEFGEAFEASLLGGRIPGTVPQVFLSYQREGAAGWAQYFARELRERHGVAVFVDVERRDGAGFFPVRLARAIEECDVFVVLLGQSTLESKWVREEMKLAYDHKRPMVPVFQESWLPPQIAPGSDPPLEALVSYDGVHLLDRRNIHVDHTIADLARVIKETLARR